MTRCRLNLVDMLIVETTAEAFAVCYIFISTNELLNYYAKFHSGMFCAI